MPLLFDMPLDELKTYNGTNPRPADFDEYWQNGLEEMYAVNGDIELAPADFQTGFARCYHMYYTGVGGARIHAQLIKPTHVAEPHPAVLMFHGYASNAGDWSSKLGYAALGFTVAALDCRGQGGRSEDKGGVTGWTLRGHIIRGLDGPEEKLLFRQIFLDTAQLARSVMERPDGDGERVGATGGSQGGGLTLACAALEPRIRRIASLSPFLSDYQRVWEIDQVENAYAELGEYFRRFDPRHERQEKIFTKLGYIDVQHLAPRIKAEVLMSVGLMDTVCPPSTQFAAYNKITADKTVELYPDYGHEDLPGSEDRIFQFLADL